MGIREILAKRDAIFISFNDLLKEMAETEGVSTRDAARAFLLCGLAENAEGRVYDQESDAFSTCDADVFIALAQDAKDGTEHRFLNEKVINAYNLGEPGFLKYDAAVALAKAGLPIPDRLAEPAKAFLKKYEGIFGEHDKNQQSKPAPGVAPFIARQWIALNDAAVLLSGDVPHPRAYTVDDTVLSWERTLDQAADSKEIRENPDWEGGSHKDRPLSHSDIRRWCARHGYTWPVPLPETSQPEGAGADSELAAELDRARARIAELENERTVLLKKIESAAEHTAAPTINSPTLRRIIEAVCAYPAWRATKPQEPNLKSVLDWQENQQRDKGNGSRVAHVAHHVIAEHFGLKS